MNKKVLLSVLSAGLLAATVTPALANENPINGGANKPGAYDQPTVGGGVNDAYNSQTEFVSARTVEEYLKYAFFPLSLKIPHPQYLLLQFQDELLRHLWSLAAYHLFHLLCQNLYT